MVSLLTAVFWSLHVNGGNPESRFINKLEDIHNRFLTLLAIVGSKSSPCFSVKFSASRYLKLDYKRKAATVLEAS